jgi:hypothetical protein
LVRHASISFRWLPVQSRAWSSQYEQSKAELLQSVNSGVSFPPLLSLHELDASSAPLDGPIPWRIVLVHPSMRELRVLRMQGARKTCKITSGMIGLLASLPHLHTLIMRPNTQTKPDALDQLHTMPSLTSLERDAFCTSPLMAAHLQSLTLTLFQAGGIRSLGLAPPSAAEYEASFSSLRSLHTLRLERIYSIDLLLPSLVHLPSLVDLHLQCVCMHSLAKGSSMTPSPVVVAQLMTARPSLRCSWLQSFHASVQPIQQRFLDQFIAGSELSQMGDRFTFRLEAP